MTSAVTVDGTTDGTATLALGSYVDTVGTVSVAGGGSITGTGTLTSTGTFEMQSGSVSVSLGGTGIALNKTTAGTAGVGAASHIGGLYFEQKTGAKVRFIPYRGGGPALQDLVAGQIDMMFDQAANSIPQIQGGKIKVFAVTAKERLKALPESRLAALGNLETFVQNRTAQTVDTASPVSSRMGTFVVGSSAFTLGSIPPRRPRAPS